MHKKYKLIKNPYFSPLKKKASKDSKIQKKSEQKDTMHKKYKLTKNLYSSHIKKKQAKTLK